MKNFLVYDEDSEPHTTLGDWHRVKITGFAFLTLSDVRKIYTVLNDNKTKNLEQFAQKAKKIAVKVPGEKTDYIYQFRDEAALFELYQSEMPIQLKQKGITCWGRLMQYIS